MSSISKSRVIGFELAALSDSTNTLREKADLPYLTGLVVRDGEDERGRDSLIFGKRLEGYTHDTVDVVIQPTARIGGLAGDFSHEGLGSALERVHPIDDGASFGLREGNGVHSSLRDLRGFLRQGIP